MDRRRDLLRAQAFARRRLVAAFTTGRAEIDPSAPSPWRALAAGVAASAVLLGGSWVVGNLRGSSLRLAQGSVLVDLESGSQYVVWRGGTTDQALLVAVPDRSTARLVLGRAPQPVRSISSASVLRVARISPPWAAVGVEVGKPPAGTRWRSCATTPESVQSAKAADSTGPVTADGVTTDLVTGDAVVETESGVRWLLHDSGDDLRRHRLTAATWSLPTVLGLPVLPVADSWVEVVAVGTRITPLPDGELVATRNGFGFRRGSQLARATPFAAAVHEATTGRSAVIDQSGELPDVTDPEIPAGWPERVSFPDRPGGTDAGGVPCLELQPAGDIALVTSSAAIPPGQEESLEPAMGMRVQVSGTWLRRQGAQPAEVKAAANEVVLWREAGRSCVALVGRETAPALGVDPDTFPVAPQAWAEALAPCRIVSLRQVRAEVAAAVESAGDR